MMRRDKSPMTARELFEALKQDELVTESRTAIEDLLLAGAAPYEAMKVALEAFDKDERAAKLALVEWVRPYVAGAPFCQVLLEKAVQAVKSGHADVHNQVDALRCVLADRKELLDPYFFGERTKEQGECLLALLLAVAWGAVPDNRDASCKERRRQFRVNVLWAVRCLGQLFVEIGQASALSNGCDEAAEALEVLLCPDVFEHETVVYDQEFYGPRPVDAGVA